MNSTTTISIVDGIKIVVPDSLNLITTYVLREQGDWFEDEIKFIRKLIEPGQKVIDIGANYGVYTLTLAKLVGETGCIWAFEPSSTTAKHLEESITTNNISHVVLEKAALSNNNGIAKLSLNDNSELNALVHGYDGAGMVETVPVITLDEYMKLNDLPSIDFIKLDAEGEETNIINGGVDFFSKHSPLIQYEIKAGKDLHLELIREFEKIGYYSYRLVPGLNILVPFREDELVDDYLLNLFCCKSDRARLLSSRGILVEHTFEVVNESVLQGTSCGEFSSSGKDAWLNELTRLPYGEKLSATWEQMVSSGKCPQIASALSCYQTSQNESLPAAKRFNALKNCFFILFELCEKHPDYLRFASLARVAREYGARSIAVNALGNLCNIIFQQKAVNANEPFLSPSSRFDNISPGNTLGKWIAAASLEELELNSAFSSYYTGKSSKQRLIAIRNLGYGSEEMKRRLDLVEQRFSTVTP